MFLLILRSRSLCSVSVTSMYSIGKGDISEYAELAHYCVESGKLDRAALEGCDLDKLMYNGFVIALVGHKEIQFEEYPGKKFILVSAVFRRDIKKHVRALKEVGGPYLDSIQKYPLIALAQEGNRVYGKFLESFGFVFTKTVEKDSETGIMYKVYVRC